VKGVWAQEGCHAAVRAMPQSRAKPPPEGGTHSRPRHPPGHEGLSAAPRGAAWCGAGGRACRPRPTPPGCSPPARRRSGGVGWRFGRGLEGGWSQAACAGRQLWPPPPGLRHSGRRPAGRAAGPNGLVPELACRLQVAQASARRSSAHLAHAQQEAQAHERRRRAHEREGAGRDAPRQRQHRQPNGRAQAQQHEVGGHLAQRGAQREHARRQAVGRGGQPQVGVHRERRERQAARGLGGGAGWRGRAVGGELGRGRPGVWGGEGEQHATGGWIEAASEGNRRPVPPNPSTLACRAGALAAVHVGDEHHGQQERQHPPRDRPLRRPQVGVVAAARRRRVDHGGRPAPMGEAARGPRAWWRVRAPGAAARGPASPGPPSRYVCHQSLSCQAGIELSSTRVAARRRCG
jgi:hypothetical protein